MFALLLLALAAHADVTEPIGTLGATFDLPDGWRRGTISAGLGPDQFLGEEAFGFVLEVRGAWLEPEDLRRKMEEVGVGIAAKNGTPTREITVEETPAGLHAHQGWRAVDPVPTVFEVHFLARGGLGYLVFAWTGEGDEAKLKRFARQLTRRLHMPGPGSPWALTSAPALHRTEVAGHEIRYTTPADLLTPYPEEQHNDAFAAFASAEDNLQVYLLLLDADGGVDDALDLALGAAGLDGPDAKVERGDRTVDGRHAKVAFFDRSTPEAPYTGAFATIPIADDLYLDVRLVTLAPFPARRAVWDAFLATIDIEPLPKVDAFPIVEAPREEAPLTPTQRGLLDAATLLGEANPGAAYRVEAGKLYTQAWKELRVLPLDGEPGARVPLGELEGPRLPASRPDGLYVPSASGSVVRVAAGAVTPAEFVAVELADAGTRGLLVVRDAETRTVAGFGELSAPGGPRVLLRADDGTERLLTELGTRDVTGLAVRDAEALLVLHDPEGSWRRRDLLVVGLDKPGQRSLGAWDGVQTVAASPEGWLVVGAPPDEPTGVYRVRPTGERTLLLSGNHAAAFPQPAGDLGVVTTWRPPGQAATPATSAVLRVPARALATHGPRFDPFTSGQLQHVARVALAGRPPDPARVLTDPAAIRAFVDAASRESEARVGVALPRDAASVDRLLAGAANADEVLPEAFLLLTALLADHLLASGATWAPGPPPSGLLVHGGADAPVNAHAWGLLPVEIVRSVLQDDEGWWDAADAIARGREGRALVLGLGPDAVRARVEALARPGLDALVRDGAPAAIIAWLTVEPDNVHLRGDVYTRLAAAGRARDLPDVAAPFLAKGAYEDQHADLAGRLARGVDGVSYPALVADLRVAIAAHQDEAALYMLLGEVYEHGIADDANLLALACYRRVEEVAWSPFREEAKARIGRLTAL